MKTRLAIILLLLLPLAVPGQGAGSRSYIDSLIQQLPRSRPDTNKVKLLDEISYAYAAVDPGTGVAYGNLAKQLADSLGWKKGSAVALFDIGVNYSAESCHSQAIYHYKKAQEVYQALGMKSSVAGVLANISQSHMATSNYTEALANAFRALKIYEELREEKNMAMVLENIGTIYLEQKRYDKAMAYYTDALELQERVGSKRDVARVLGNMGIVHDANGDYEEALGNHRLALETNRSSGNMHSAQINLVNIGIVYAHMKEYPEALMYEMEALRISESLGSERDIAVNLGNIGETYYFIATDSVTSVRPDSLIPRGKAANLDRAILYLEKGVEGCRALSYFGPLVEFTLYLSQAHSLAGNYEKACEVYKEHVAVKDTIFSQQNRIRLSDLESERALYLKDKEIIIRDKQLEIVKLEAANRRNERVMYISGIVLLLGVAGVVITRSARKSRAHKTILSDIADIQSHEIRGPVARILGLVKLFNHNEPADPVNRKVIGYIRHASEELDHIVKKVVTKTTGEDIHDQPNFDSPAQPKKDPQGPVM